MAMGNGTLYCCLSYSVGQSSARHKHMDKIPCYGDSWKSCDLDGIYSSIRHCRAKTSFLDRVRGYHSKTGYESCVLGNVPGHAVCGTQPWFCMEIVSLLLLYVVEPTDPRFSAKRMYYPQSYHHVQEIQKYNIQDYRPRYDPQFLPSSKLLLTHESEWNNSRKLSEKYGKCRECVSKEVMRSRKPMRVSRGWFKPMIPRKNEENTARWRVCGSEKRCLQRSYVYFFGLYRPVSSSETSSVLSGSLSFELLCSI